MQRWRRGLLENRALPADHPWRTKEGEGKQGEGKGEGKQGDGQGKGKGSSSR